MSLPDPSDGQSDGKATGEADPYSVLLMGFGQSNADVHDAGPRLYPSGTGRPQDALPVLMPNDGKGIRGYMGGARGAPISGFVPVGEASDRVQSLLAAAAARLLHDSGDAALKRVIVRSEARGGRRFFGIQNNGVIVEGIFRNIDGAKSIIFQNLLTTIRECVQAARNDGCPIRIVNIVWLHGKSDRAMSRAEYRDILLELIDEVERRLADTGVSFEWSIVQPAGTGPRGGGNYWPNRLAVFDVADKRDNVTVAVAGYPYEQMDGAHFSGYGKLLLGENIGRMIARRMAGFPHSVPRVVDAVLNGQDVVLTFHANDPIFLDDLSTPFLPDTLMGFQARDRSGSVLVNVVIAGADQLQLSFDRPPDPHSLTIDYAYARNPRRSAVIEGDYPVGGGCLRTTASERSILADGANLHDWVAGFSLSLSQ